MCPTISLKCVLLFRSTIPIIHKNRFNSFNFALLVTLRFEFW